MSVSRSLIAFLVVIASVSAFQSPAIRGNRMQTTLLQMKAERISVMVNGMPGPMAVEVAKACLDRGYNLIPMGFTGPNQPEHLTVTGANTFVDVELVAGPGVSDSAGKALSVLKELHPNLIIVDYTHPSAILNNLACYVENDCDFVMGTTGGDTEKMMEIFNKGKNKAVIAPNMAKQIVALQAALLAMANRFPKSFANYKLTVNITSVLFDTAMPLFKKKIQFAPKFFLLCILLPCDGLTFLSSSILHVSPSFLTSHSSLLLPPLLAGHRVSPVFQGRHIRHSQGHRVPPTDPQCR